jgi:hypothetical protein
MVRPYVRDGATVPFCRRGWQTLGALAASSRYPWGCVSNQSPKRRAGACPDPRRQSMSPVSAPRGVGSVSRYAAVRRSSSASGSPPRKGGWALRAPPIATEGTVQILAYTTLTLILERERFLDDAGAASIWSYDCGRIPHVAALLAFVRPGDSPRSLDQRMPRVGAMRGYNPALEVFVFHLSRPDPP